MTGRTVLMAVICLAFLAALLDREGPLGPPFYSYEQYGEIHIKAATWLLSEGGEDRAAAISCEKRLMSPVSVKLTPPRMLSLFGDSNMPLGPQWVHIICSP